MKKRRPGRKVYGVILTGGMGKRLWPLSTASQPKSLISILGRKPTVQNIFRDIKAVRSVSRVLFVVDKAQVSALKRAVKGLSPSDIVAEPCSRNTLPAIALAAFRTEPGSVIAVVSSDSEIVGGAGYRTAIARGIDFAKKNNDAIVCVGIQPSEPSGSYGYIKLGNEAAPGVFRAARFIEKPAEQTAAGLFSSGSYLWNAGIFIFTKEAIIRALMEYAPDLYRRLSEVRDGKAALSRAYSRFESISIDYKIIENAKNVFCVKGDFSWRDMGNWGSIEEVYRKKPDDNVIVGRAVVKGSKAVSVLNAGLRPVGVIGAENIIVVNTDSGVLVCGRQYADKVKELGFI